MSIKHYKHVWNNYPEVKGSHKLVLLALAEFANDETNECWPSIARLSQMTGLKDRQVQNLLRDLKSDGYIEVEVNHGRKNTNVYKFTMAEKVQSTAPFIDEEKEEKVQSSTEKVQSSNIKGAVDCTRSIIEPIRNNNTDEKEQPVVRVGKTGKRKKEKESGENTTPVNQEWFGAVCWLAYGHQDYALLSKMDNINIGKTVKEIRASKNEYTIDDLRNWYKTKWSNEWPGKQPGKSEIQRPTLHQIKVGIGQVKAKVVSFNTNTEINKSIATIGELER